MGLGEHDVRPKLIGRYPKVPLEGWGLFAGCASLETPKTPRFLSPPGNIAEAMSCLKKSRGNWGQSPQRHHEGGEAATASVPRPI